MAIDSDKEKKQLSKRKVDVELWNYVKKCAALDERKTEAVQIIFRRHYELPEESINLVNKLASSEQPRAVRLEIVKNLGREKNIPFGMYRSLISILSTDPDDKIRIIVLREGLRVGLGGFALNFGVISEILKQLPPFGLSTGMLGANAKTLTDAASRLGLSTGMLGANAKTLTDAASRLGLAAALGIDKKILEQFNALPSIIPTKQLVEMTTFSKNLTNQINRNLLRNTISYYEPTDLQPLQRPSHIPAKSKAKELVKKLAECIAGNDNWTVFEDVCKEILSYCLVPPLLEPRVQSRTIEGLHKRDLIFHIPHGVKGFWQWVLSKYGIAIIVDCKNYSGYVKENDFVITGKYLRRKKLTQLGLIVTRNGTDGSGRKGQVNELRDSDSLIICLIDKDLLKMLELKEKNDEPWKVIDYAIREFLESLE